MPCHVYRCSSRPRLDLWHNLCVTLTTCDIVSFAVLTVYVSACCAVMCANHAGKKRRPPPLPPIYVSRPAVSSPVIIHAGRFSENVRDDDSKFISFAEIPLGPNRGVREMYS